MGGSEHPIQHSNTKIQWRPDPGVINFPGNGHRQEVGKWHAPEGKGDYFMILNGFSLQSSLEFQIALAHQESNWCMITKG
jgi:hypothetical protein